MFDPNDGRKLLDAFNKWHINENNLRSWLWHYGASLIADAESNIILRKENMRLREICAAKDAV